MVVVLVAVVVASGVLGCHGTHVAVLVVVAVVGRRRLGLLLLMAAGYGAHVAVLMVVAVIRGGRCRHGTRIAMLMSVTIVLMG